MTHHTSAAARPSTEAAQDRAAITELCKAVDHIREALWLVSDDNSDLAIAVNHARRTLKEAISIATNGRVQP